MKDIIKISVIFLGFSLFVFMPKVSYADDGHHGRDDGRGHYHHFHNPDLTLVTGMDDIDSRVLIAADPDVQSEEVIDQVPVIEPPADQISDPMDGNYFVVNVPNNTGGYTPVRIQKWGNAYMGPNGELFYPFPEISQLKAMYGI